MRPAWAEVDLGAIAENVRLLRQRAAPAAVCAVVKADGYGHGAVPAARAALAGGADVLAVALAEEGATLRRAGIDARIFVLSQASPGELGDLVAHDLEATVYTPAGIEALLAVEGATPSGHPLPVHLKVDTGMHRVGVAPDGAVALAQRIHRAPELELRSVFTHFAVADEPGNPYTAEQLARLRAVVAAIEAAGIGVPCVHAANTAAALDHPDARLDRVRCGIGIYGLDPAPALAGRLPLTPAMSMVAEVSHVKRVTAGEALSYGLRYRLERESTIATVPVGYADGVPRGLSAAGATVLVGGRRRPIAGTITMDQLLVDCGDDAVAVGDPVVLLGRQGDEEIGAAEWAEALGTIAYEIVCGVSPRIPRRYREVPE